ncbi:MAG: 2-amino-4-hydroxy-6-hydroxymethyldihydropteridine diphosphokinase [Methylophaga sp.]|nr:MAG: 2-amino-4-hydroxy-6-hydroxymethyldihydropteridine diphosphokinase [Methylophaga sp.]
MNVFIGLGSNLTDPVFQVKTAIDDLTNLPDIQLLASSFLYKSSPMGPQDQPDYINAVVALETNISPHSLLDQLQQIEQKHGRIRQRHWGERTLDLDLLIYGEQIVDDERLTVPHPGISTRSFVLYPLFEIAADLDIPTMGKIEQLIKQCPRDDLQRVEDF